MKIAIFGDLHFGISKSSDIYHEYFDKSLNYFIDECDNRGVTTVIQTGDIYDHRREVHFNTLTKTRQYFFNRIKRLGMQFVVIAGNHDCMYKNTNKINSINSLHLDEFIIIDQAPTTMHFHGCNIDFYPWINDSNLKESLEFAASTKSKYCVGHFEFANFPMYPGTIAEHGMDHKLFNRYETVFSGHYHTRSIADNVYYVGTPYELTWGDCGDTKGIVILDTETGEKEFIPNPYTMFTKLTYVEGDDVDPDTIKDHYVKVVVADKPDQKKFDKWLDKVRSYGPHDIKIIESSIVDAVAEAVASSKKIDLISTQSVIQSVVQNMDTQLDKGLLMKKIMEVYTEAEHTLS